MEVQAPDNDHSRQKFGEIPRLLREGNAAAAESAARALAQQGDCHAFALLGAVYEFGGHAFERDPRAAFENYRKSIDMCGSVEGILGVARLYYVGSLGHKDLKSSFQMYELIADSNYVAQYMLGRMYLNGEGVDKDLMKAEMYARLALESRNAFAFALLADIHKARGKSIRCLIWSTLGWCALHFRKQDYLARKI